MNIKNPTHPGRNILWFRLSLRDEEERVRWR